MVFYLQRSLEILFASDKIKITNWVFSIWGYQRCLISQLFYLIIVSIFFFIVEKRLFRRCRRHSRSCSNWWLLGKRKTNRHLWRISTCILWWRKWRISEHLQGLSGIIQTYMVNFFLSKKVCFLWLFSHRCSPFYRINSISILGFHYMCPWYLWYFYYSEMVHHPEIT